MGKHRRWVGLLGLGLAGTAAIWTASSEAQPPGPETFCGVYPEAPACLSGEVTCSTCHIAPPELNVYGLDVASYLATGEDRPLHEDVFAAQLGNALVAVESLDSDGDGYDNLEEIEGGTSPSQSSSFPRAPHCEDTNPKDGWNVCGKDLDYAFKKVTLDFCGHSPALVAREAFAEADNPRALLHDTLDDCLDSEHWRGMQGRVWNVANRKIGPQQAVKAGKNAGPIPLADYDDDYAYFVWTQTDDRDARLVLTGTSFVTARFVGGLTEYDEWSRTPDRDFELRGYDLYQAVAKPHRAGLLTHRWFLMSNTMFTGIPRTTAAQAYRGFLGYDISRLEGLHPVPGEPLDYDNKGVTAEGCAGCHSTLDPLSYPFSRYEGIGGGNGYYEPFAYNEARMDSFVWVDGPSVADTPEAGVLFDQPVANLVEWAEVAANSEAFRRATVLDYWQLLFHEEPRATEQGDFGALVQAFGTDHDYRIERMLHDLIDTEAYGAP